VRPDSLRAYRRGAALFLLGLATLVSDASAGVNTWTTGGPLAGRVPGLAADLEVPGLVYASIVDDRRGVSGTFRTTTNGVRWTRLGLDVPIGALATGPARTVYAGGDNSADFKSADAGGTWHQISPLNTTARVSFIRVDARAESRVYREAVATVWPTGPPPGFLYRSFDGGSTWESIQQDLGFGVVWDMAIDPINEAVLYAVKDSGYYKSEDFGTTWSRVQNNLPTAEVRALVLDPVSPGTVYAAGLHGFYRSRDSGLSFSRIGSGLPGSAIDALISMPSQPGRLFAGTRTDGVYATADAGDTWFPFNSGLGNLEITSLALDASGAWLHAGTAAGVYDYQFGSETLVLNVAHQFRAQAFARDQRTGGTGTGFAKALGDLAGYFSIPELTQSPDTPEVFVKIVDGRAINGRYWIFHGGLTDLEYTLTVTEEATGRVKTYFKPAGSACGEFDTAAFGP
jgi:hypothetical protein